MAKRDSTKKTFVNDRDDNVFIGHQAGGGTWADVASNYNVGIGNYAMDAALNGAGSNVAIGYNAFGAATTTDGIDANIAIGSSVQPRIIFLHLSVKTSISSSDNMLLTVKNPFDSISFII